METNTLQRAEPDDLRTVRGPGVPGEPRAAAALRPLAPGMRRLLFTASVLVLLAGIQLFVFTGQTGHFFAFTIGNPLSATFLGAGYLAAVAIEALAGRQALWANARIAVPAVLVFTLLTLAVTLTHLGQLHLGARFAIGTQVVTAAWITIYVLVPALMLILLLRQVRTPGADPPRAAGLPAWLYAVLAVQAAVLVGLGIALFAAPVAAAPLWPWKLTPIMAQAIGAWLIGLGVAAGADAGRTGRAPRAARRRRVPPARRLPGHRARPLPPPVPLGIRLRHHLPDHPRHHAADRRSRPRPGTATRGPPIRPRTGCRRGDHGTSRTIAIPISSLTTRQGPKQPLPPHLHHPSRAGREGFWWGWVWPERGSGPPPQAKPAKDAQPQRSPPPPPARPVMPAISGDPGRRAPSADRCPSRPTPTRTNGASGRPG